MNVMMFLPQLGPAAADLFCLTKTMNNCSSEALEGNPRIFIRLLADHLPAEIEYSYPS